LRAQHAAWSLAGSIALFAANASAEGIASGAEIPEAFELSYRLGPGAAACPAEQSLRNAVAAQFGGLDPFSAVGARRMDVAIAQRKAVFVGEIAFVDADGRRLGRQEIASPSCRALVEGLAISLSIAIRPFVRTSAPAPAPAPDPPHPPAEAEPAAAERGEPEPRPAGTARPELEARPARPARPARRARPAATTRPARSAARTVPAPPAAPRWELGVGPVLAVGFAADLAAGFAGSAGIRWPNASLALEVRGDLPVTTQLDQGRSFEMSWLGGSAVSCLHGMGLFGCGMVTVGQARRVSLSDGYSDHGAMAYAGLGFRAGLEVPFSSRLAAQLSLDLLINAARPRFTDAEQPGWIAGPTAEALALRLVTRF
jgi:hypothetical protein